MEKINPFLYITDTDPVPEAVLDASKWFATEYAVVDSTNKDSGFIEWFLAQGWVEYARFQNGPLQVWGDSVTQEEREAWTRKTYLKRRKIQAESVMNDMLREFTEAYNEGREINDRRYDEIVQVYAAMLSKSEDEIISLSTPAYDFCSQIEALILKFEPDFNLFKADVTGLLDGYGIPRLADINVRFDNELAKARQSLVERGMNNSTLWPSVSAGIERERERTLTDAHDAIVDRKLASSAKIHEARESFRTRMVTSYERLMELKRENKLTPLKFRNDILVAMVNFMERRSDEYPGLDSLTSIASQLGFSEGGATVAPTA